MSELAELLSTIDTVTTTACASCDGPLEDSPSADFCSPDCQDRWHALRSYELVGYREPLYDWATLGPWPEDFEDNPLPPLTATARSLDFTLRIDTDAFDAAMRRMAAMWQAVLTADLTGNVYYRITQPSGIRTTGWHGRPIIDEVQWHSVRITQPPASTAHFEWYAPDVEEMLRPSDTAAAERHVEVCGDCTSQADAERHAARLGVALADLGRDAALSWPQHSMRGVIAEPLPPTLTERLDLRAGPPHSAGPQRRQRAPRTLGRTR